MSSNLLISTLTAAPDNARTLELGCGRSYEDFGGETGDCDQAELIENHVELCVCDYDNCNGRAADMSALSAGMLAAAVALVRTLK